MGTIKSYKCSKGHYSIWNECPYCYASEKKSPTINDQMFLNLFNRLKTLSPEEIEKEYNVDFEEPEQPLRDPSELFK